MFCSRCGKQIEDNSNFCKFCGENCLHIKHSKNCFEDKLSKVLRSILTSGVLKRIVLFAIWFYIVAIVTDTLEFYRWFGLCVDDPLTLIIVYSLVGILGLYVLWYIIQAFRRWLFK